MQENQLRGYERPSDDLVDRFPPLELVAKLGYAAARGARCPECRGVDAEHAFAAIPRTDTDDPIEKRIFQYRQYGAYEPLPGTGWGASWAGAAKRRGVPTDAEVDGQPVWAVTHTDDTEPSFGSAGQESVITDTRLDEYGRTPITDVTTERKLFGRKTTLITTWVPGPVRGGMQPLRDKDVERLMWLILKSVSRPVFFIGDNADSSWIGLAPERIHEWFVARATDG